MNLRFYILLTLTLLAGAGLRAEEKPLVITMFDVRPTEKHLRDLAAKLSPLIAANLSINTNFVMVERAQLSKALNEQALGLSGGVSADAAAQVGHMTGAKILISGSLLRHGTNHLIMVANIIGAETGRLYTEICEVHFPTDVPLFAAEISRGIATNILKNASNLVIKLESREEQIKRIVQSVKGTKRPSVQVNVTEAAGGGTNVDLAVNIELGMILQKAGFTLVDEKSDRKPEIQITGISDYDCAARGTDLFSCRATLALKVQDRATGRIMAFDRQESSALDLGNQTAGKRARETAADEMAERIVPLLAE